MCSMEDVADGVPSEAAIISPQKALLLYMYVHDIIWCMYMCSLIQLPHHVGQLLCLPLLLLLTHLIQCTPPPSLPTPSLAGPSSHWVNAVREGE